MRDVRWGSRATLVEKLDINKVVSPEAKVVDLGGTTNLNLLVSEPTPYVIRVYRPEVVRRRIIGLRNLRRRLEKFGLRVPDPIQIAQREVIRLSDRWAEAESYLPHLPAQSEQYPQVFAALGELHRAILTCWEGTMPEPPLSNYGTVAQLKTWLQGSARRMGARADEQDALRRAAGAIQTLGNLEQEYITSLPQALVHGDYTLSNIGFTASGEPVYLDFDVATVKPRVHELAYAALIMLRHMEHSVDPAAASWGVVWHMVDEYERTAMMPLNRLERLAFPIEMARVSLCFVARAGFPSANERSWSELTRGLAEAECILRMVV